MKIALLVCKGQVAVDSVITETDLSLTDFFLDYVKKNGYPSCSVLKEDKLQLRALIHTDDQPSSIENTLGAIVFCKE